MCHLEALFCDTEFDLSRSQVGYVSGVITARDAEAHNSIEIWLPISRYRCSASVMTTSFEI